MKWLIMAYSPTSTSPQLYEINDEVDNVTDAVQSIMSDMLKDNKEEYGTPSQLKAKSTNGTYKLTATYAAMTEDDINVSVSVLAKSEQTLSIKYPSVRTFPDFNNLLNEVTDADVINDFMS